MASISRALQETDWWFSLLHDHRSTTQYNAQQRRNRAAIVVIRFVKLSNYNAQFLMTSAVSAAMWSCIITVCSYYSTVECLQKSRSGAQHSAFSISLVMTMESVLYALIAEGCPSWAAIRWHMLRNVLMSLTLRPIAGRKHIRLRWEPFVGAFASMLIKAMSAERFKGTGPQTSLLLGMYGCKACFLTITSRSQIYVIKNSFLGLKLVNLDLQSHERQI